MKVSHIDKSSGWIDDVIKQHKKQLQDFKMNRQSIEELSESKFHVVNKSSDIQEENKSYLKYKNDEENLYKNIPSTEHTLSKSGYNPKANLNLNFNYENRNPYNELNHNEDISPTQSQAESGQHQTNPYSDQLESKKKKINQLKHQLENLFEENSNLKNKIVDLESYKQNTLEQVQSYGIDIQNSQATYAERERELVNTIRQLEQDKIKVEEKLNRILSLDNVKSQEIELMHQKLSDFELIIDENSNDHIDSLKNLKTELESQKNKNFENEKFFDVLNYFFRKMHIHYGNYDSVIGVSQSADYTSGKIFKDTKSFQDKLIELENFIIKILNERSMLHHKYSKILDIQAKITNNESGESSQLHLENIKKLNEKIFDLKEENNLLKKQMQTQNQNNSIHHRQRESIKEKEQDSFKHTKDFEDNLEKENIFTNNYIKDREESYNKKQKRIENVRKSTASHKTLEERVFELERELNLYDRSEDSKYDSESDKYSNKRSLNTIDNNLRRRKPTDKNTHNENELMKSPSVNKHNRSLIQSDFNEQNHFETNEDQKKIKLKKSVGLEKNNINNRDKSGGVVSRKENINKAENKKLKPGNELRKGKPIEKVVSKKKK